MQHLDDPETLLGRLQRGRGDAVRDMLTLPRAEACPVLVRCLCTAADLAQHGDAYVELVMALAPDLTEWFHWVGAMSPADPEPVRCFAFNMLGDLAARGHAGASGCLRHEAVHGGNWNFALDQYLLHALELDQSAWLTLLDRVDDQTLRNHIRATRRSRLWPQLAGQNARVANLVRAVDTTDSAYAANVAWSPSNYAAAELSQRRWKVLQSLLASDAEAAIPLVIDGLWDGSHLYRNYCIELVSLHWPSVRARLQELASMPGSRSSAQAKRRLDRG